MPAGVEPQAEAPSAYALLYAKGQFQPLLFIGFLGGVSFCGFGVSLVWYVVGLGILFVGRLRLRKGRSHTVGGKRKKSPAQRGRAHGRGAVQAVSWRHDNGP